MPDTLDLFGPSEANQTREALLTSFEHWVAHRAQSASSARSSRPLREESIEMYRDMWQVFAAWCAERSLALASVDEAELTSFLDSLGRTRDASPRYAKRMLQLIGRVDRHEALQQARPPNAVISGVAQTPRYQFADADDAELPVFLNASLARRLIDHVTRRAGADGSLVAWQEIRNRTAVALQLGGGLSPGEARQLRIPEIIIEGGRKKNEPWALALPANGNYAARQTPLARWAGRQLRYWLDIRAAQRIPGDAVFPSTRSGKVWSKASSINAFQAVLEAAGVSPVGGSYKLRHTFALRQLTRYPSEDVARWLGVQDQAVMARYQRVLMQPVELV
ncbi:MAG: tyrosine-type recombinase/integrase [Flavobacteriaceae bacterium]